MSVSLCVLRIEIDEEMGDNPTEAEAAREQKKKDRGARESKTITVETYASVLMGPNAVSGILPTSSRRSSPDDNNDSEEDDKIAFFCGNPLVEVTKGVLHLYKENELRDTVEARMLCLLGVPGALGARDLLAFAAACQPDIAHVRVLRDGSPDHYMALLTFRTASAAKAFHTAFDGAAYTSLEPAALCHAAWVARIEWARNASPPLAHTELPTCAVCLERMDESVAGLLSVQCAHSFHASCLTRWGDASCPVCRCACTPEPRAAARCLQCEAGDAPPAPPANRDPLLDEVDAGALWICLICGHVGCGRYEGGHAAMHFVQSNHTYALQLGSNRVWDYAGDNFVHRLVQNKGDGKLVAAEAGESTDKLEFTYLLTAQLDAQRAHYQHRIDKLEEEHTNECENLKKRALDSEIKAGELKKQVDTLSKENKSLEKKLQHVTAKVSALQSALGEERGLAAALAASQAHWQAKATEQGEGFLKEIAELKERLRDVMFFVEARDTLAKAAPAEELESAALTVAPPPDKRKPRRKRR